MPHTDRESGSPYVRLAAIALGAVVVACVATMIIMALVQ